MILQIKSTKPDKFTPRIAEKKDDYVRVEYESPILGVRVTHIQDLICNSRICFSKKQHEVR